MTNYKNLLISKQEHCYYLFDEWEVVNKKEIGWAAYIQSNSYMSDVIYCSSYRWMDRASNTLDFDLSSDSSLSVRSMRESKYDLLCKALDYNRFFIHRDRELVLYVDIFCGSLALFALTKEMLYKDSVSLILLDDCASNYCPMPPEKNPFNYFIERVLEKREGDNYSLDL